MENEIVKKDSLNISNKSERVVVDEIFDNGTARLLCAKRLPDAPKDDCSIRTWREEKEAFMDVWRFEAFVGFPSRQSLREGDVFFISDGTKLNNTYKPVPRDVARKENLILPWEISTKIARTEIKKQFYKLAATQMTSRTKDRETLLKRVDQKFKTDTPDF